MSRSLRTKEKKKEGLGFKMIWSSRGSSAKLSSCQTYRPRALHTSYFGYSCHQIFQLSIIVPILQLKIEFFVLL